MLVLVVLGLSAAALVVLSLGLYMFVDVAFTGVRSAERNRWQPPLASGDELVAWAAGVASAVATKHLRGPRRGSIARELSSEIAEGASFAISRSVVSPTSHKPRCATCSCRRIGVTAAEALAIADALRTTKGSRETAKIRDRAATNAAKTNLGMDHEAESLCPLLASDSTCIVFDERPIMCRGWDVDGVAGVLHTGGRCSGCNASAKAVSRGAEEGLSHALQDAGLDGEIYELNSALVTALGTPSAPARWAKGEPVFSECKKFK